VCDTRKEKIKGKRGYEKPATVEEKQERDNKNDDLLIIPSLNLHIDYSFVSLQGTKSFD